jgi:hypothetical protein
VAGDESKPSSPPPLAPSPTGVSPAASREELKEGRDAIRSSLQKTGSALAAGATVLLTALGLTQAYELFPLPQNLSDEDEKALLITAFLGALAAIGGAALLAARFFWAQRRILLNSRGLQGEDDEEEKRVVGQVLTEHAREQTAQSLHALELRALRLERIARRRSASRPAREVDPAQDQADYLNGVISIALARASAVLLERRARDVYRSGWSALGLAAAILGLVAIFGVGDYAEGQRDLVELRKTCSEAKPPSNACETVVAAPESEQDEQADQSAQQTLEQARTFINEYASRGNRGKAAQRTAATARLIAACEAIVTKNAPNLVEARASAAIQQCVTAARRIRPAR